jgi:Phage terminase large subunit (GpA)
LAKNPRTPPLDRRLLADGLRRAAARVSVEAAAAMGPTANYGFLAWAHRVPEAKTGRLDFEQFPFQRELYTDGVEDPEVVVMKSTQIGASAWLARWAVFWADRGKTVLYVFPTEEQLRSFSNERIAPLLRGPHLAKRVEHAAVSNVNQRQIGSGWLNLRGAQTVAGLESIDADALAIDEYDLVPARSIPVAERRISAPTSMGLIRRIGWPSIDDYGIARKYNQSDRRRWFVKCPCCGERQFLRFFPRRSAVEDEEGDGLPNATSGYVDRGDGLLRCGRCEKPLAPDTVRNGEWVAEFPTRELRGYHVHRLLVPGARLSAMIEASRETRASELQSFYNRDLGEPYSPKEGRLSRAAIAAAQSAGGNYLQGPLDVGYAGDGVVTMGVDSASARDLNVRISLYAHDLSSKRALFIGTVGSFDELAEMMDIYRVRMAAIDHLPDGRLARDFTQRFYGRAFFVRFLPPAAREPFVFDPVERSAAINRTEAIDTTLALIRTTRNRLPIDVPEGYVDHMRNVVRFHELDELGRQKVGYRALGPNDYLMAEVYDYLALRLLQADLFAGQILQTTHVCLEDYVEFERSTLLDLDAPYSPGPDETYYWELEEAVDREYLPYWSL